MYIYWHSIYQLISLLYNYFFISNPQAPPLFSNDYAPDFPSVLIVQSSWSQI